MFHYSLFPKPTAPFAPKVIGKGVARPKRHARGACSIPSALLILPIMLSLPWAKILQILFYALYIMLNTA